MAGESGSSSTPAPKHVGDIRWEDLSPQSVAILRKVVWPIHGCGHNATTVAKQLDIKVSAVPLLIDYFKAEVAELAQPSSSGGQPPISNAAP